jgi:hypothetical protein
MADYRRRFQQDSERYGADKALWLRQLFPESDDSYFGLTCTGCKAEVSALSEQCRAEVDAVAHEFLERRDLGEAASMAAGCEIARIRGYWRGRASAIMRLALLEGVTW